MDAAEIVETATGTVPRGEGWYVLNVKQARWQHNVAFGANLSFQGDVRFAEFGINLGVLEPGQPACMYHAEENQEGFLARYLIDEAARRHGASVSADTSEPEQAYADVPEDVDGPAPAF